MEKLQTGSHIHRINARRNWCTVPDANLARGQKEVKVSYTQGFSVFTWGLIPLLLLTSGPQSHE
jgi:hypothetical protein